MKIAIIGSGISGLTTAYLLHKDHDITVFEANDYIGGHTHTHEISQNNKMWRVDSGFIVYNEKTYPNFIKLLKELKVKVQKTTMGFSVKAPSQNLEYSGGSLNTVFAQRLNLFKPAFLIMLKDILRFNRLAAKELYKIDETTTILSFLEKHKFSKPFVENYIIPMGAAIWSTAANKTTEMPAAFYIRFFKNHGLLQIFNRPQWYVIKGGSKSYVQKIIEGFQEKILLSKPVIKVERNPSEVKIYCEKEADPLFFDKVVINSENYIYALITILGSIFTNQKAPKYRSNALLEIGQFFDIRLNKEILISLTKAGAAFTLASLSCQYTITFNLLTPEGIVMLC